MTVPRPGGGRAFALRVGDPDPGAVRVLGVVEPVAADVVPGEDVAGDQRTPDAQDPRREQVLLDLRGGSGGLQPAGAVDVVGVGGGESDRGRALGREIAECVVGRPDGHQHADRAPAQVHRGDDRAGEELVDRGAQRRDAFARDLRTDRDRDRDLRRERGWAGEALHRRAFEVDEIDRG